MLPSQLPPRASEWPMEPATATTPPALLGKYRLGRILGRGSFAKVYEAYSVADSSPVAIKIIDKHNKSLNALPEPQILREVSTMKRVQSHPNILKIHEVMATKSKIYLVMELAPGGDLFSKIARRGRLTEASTRRIFRQIISALHFCHLNGVFHRDVKPQNLLFDIEGNLKISDFGLSSLPEQLRDGLLHTTCGTPAFTAPEVVSRRGYDGAQADAWSCGVILFVLLAGQLPFDDHNLVTMYKKISRRDYQIPDWVSKPARYLVNQLLDPNPKTRMSLETLMSTSWFRKSPLIKSQSDSSLLESETTFLKDYNVNSLSSTNAFDIISMSSGLDLSGLFDSNKCIKGKRFSSNVSAEEITEKVREAAGRLGYGVEKMKDGVLKLRKGRLGLVLEVVGIAEGVALVELKVADGRDDFEDIHWRDWKDELQEIAVSWHNDSA